MSCDPSPGNLPPERSRQSVEGADASGGPGRRPSTAQVDALAAEATARPAGPRPRWQALFAELEDLVEALGSSRAYGLHVGRWPQALLLEAEALLALADTGQLLYDNLVPDRREVERIVRARDDLRVTLDLYGG